MKKLSNRNIKKIAILFIITLFISVFPAYAVESPVVTQDIQIDTNLNGLTTKRLPALYLGAVQRTYSNYNIVDKLKLNVKNQSSAGICWACSSNSVLETTVNLANNTNYIFSDSELDKQVSEEYGKELEDGANSYMAYGNYTSGNLPVTTLNEKVNIKIDDYIIFPSVYKVINGENVTYKKAINSNEYYTEEEVKTVRNSIKEHIVNYGAVTATTYIDSKYFGEDEKSYYCTDNTKNPNHQITIVGWDDNYSVDKFNSNNKPKQNGAYIVMNSYGTEFGDNGLYYISYEDIFIEYSNFGIKKTSSYQKKENIYQYDELGINYKLDFNSDVYVANVFTRENTKLQEELTSVSFSNLQDGEYEIYINAKDGILDINKFQKIKTIKTQDAGYTTVDISPITLKGEKFVIAIKSKKTETNYASIGIENNDGGFWKNATNEKGQTYFSMDFNEWYDAQELEEVVSNVKDANACIKAFTQTITLGDLNVDNEFDTRDLSIATLYIAKLLDYELTEEALKNFDVNQDGKIDTVDLSKILLVMAKFEEF